MFSSDERNARGGAVLAVLVILASGAAIGFPTPALAAPLCSQRLVFGCVPDIPTLPTPMQPPVIADQSPPMVENNCYEFSCGDSSVPSIDASVVPPVAEPGIAREVPTPGVPDVLTPVTPELPPPVYIPRLPPIHIPGPPPPVEIPGPPPIDTPEPPPIVIPGPPPPVDIADPAPPPPPVVPAPPPVPVRPPPPAASLELSDATVAPGGDVLATGKGCPPGAPVSLSIADVPVGHTVAEPGGDFRTPLTTGFVAVGRHQVRAQCDRTLTAPLEIVLVSQVGTGTSTVTVILLFLLLGGWFYGHRLAAHLSARENHDG